MAMNISSTSGVDAALTAVQSVEDKRAGLQIALLRKSLDSQQQQAADLMKLLEGKGQQVDLRV